MVFYFSGTGNSLYIAKQIEENPLSIPQARHGRDQEFSADSIGIAVNYINVIMMADNWLPGFDMNEQKKADKKIEENMAEILADLAAHKNMISEVTDTDRIVHQQFLDCMAQMPADAWQHLLRVTDDCVGCGICERVCPSASVLIEEGKAVHIPGNCQTCLACAHACPQKAVQLTIPEVNPKARYRNEHISLQEIIEANCQI